MALTKYIPTTRLSGDKVVLRTNQLARIISRQTGVSAGALSAALKILGNGIVDALANGYDFQWQGIGTFETRELKPRTRYHRMKGERYMSQPSVVVHFKKAPSLNETVRRRASARLDKLDTNPTVKPVEKR